MGVYFGALGFTQPLEKLVLCAMPLQSPLDWLSKPKGPNLVEASTAAAPNKALVLAVTKQMLYVEEPPLVGVGLVYKPHYISTEPFSAAYMHLHVWHAAGSSVDSEHKLSLSHLIFVSISEMSEVAPVAMQHPVLLDVVIKEITMLTGEPMAPLHFRGFRLHTVWTQQPGGDLVCQVAFPHFQGKGSSSMLEYEPEKLSWGLMQGPPSNDHWNITSDLTLPLVMDTFRQQREAKQTAQGLEGESEGAKVSPTESSAPGESPHVEAGDRDETITLPKE